MSQSQYSEHLKNTGTSAEVKRGGAFKFKRGYKACEACRKTKTRCDLGGLDDDFFSFSGPPCAQCRRRGRDCVFREERNTRNRHSKRFSHSKSPASRQASEDADRAQGIDSSSRENRTDSISANVLGKNSHEPSILTADRRDDGHYQVEADRSNAPSELLDSWPGSQVETEAQRAAPRLMELSRGDTWSTTDPQGKEGQMAEFIMRTLVMKGNDTINMLFDAAIQEQKDPIQISQSPLLEATQQSFIQTEAGNPQDQGNVTGLTDPAASPSYYTQSIKPSTASPDTISIWRSSKFVKMGLFPAEHAIAYIDAFFENLAPLSPILTDYFADYAHHSQLVLEEPLLCSTILMISSRYHSPSGPASFSRGRFIHDELWKSTQDLIQQILFGQDGNRLRSIGSIEALLLITDWYPRSTQFQRSQQGWEPELLKSKDSQDSQSSSWLEEIIGATKHWDRMSWMLLGCARMLAHELNILRDQDEENVGTIVDTDSRCLRVREVLYIYTTLLAARLGCYSMIPANLKRHTAGRSMEALDRTLNSWISLIQVTRTVHTLLFSSSSRTRDLLGTGEYLNLLDQVQPLLHQWFIDYGTEEPDGKSSNRMLKDLLFLEYHYVKMHTNSPALQAIALQFLSPPGQKLYSALAQRRSKSLKDQPEYPFVHGIIEDAKKIVEKVNALAKASLLRFHPARTFHRLMSSCAFMLKAQVLITRSSDPEYSMREYDIPALLHEVVRSLRISAVDDVHPAAYYAILLEHHLKFFESKPSGSKQMEAFWSMGFSELSDLDFDSYEIKDWDMHYFNSVNNFDFTSASLLDEPGLT